MLRKALGLWVVATTVVATARCAGTDTGNPATSLVAFDGSHCRNSANEKPPQGSMDGGVGTSTAALTSNADDFYRLVCIAWELGEDSTLRIDFWNVGGGCGIEWVGASARFDGDTLRLAAYEKGCMISGCGSCVYNLHFEVRGAPKGEDIPLIFVHTDENEKFCDHGGYDKPPTGPTFTIPASTEPSGVRCNPIVGGIGLGLPPTCSRHAICGDQAAMVVNSPGPCPVCPNGDVCAPIVEPNVDPYPYPNECLAPCTTDADCQNGAMGCRNGGCTVVNRFR